MANYKTPGVYIEEIAKFPPSIAAVETAIPAFIGHTKKAIKRGEDVTGKPTRISSMLEFDDYFGGAQEEQHLIVAIEVVKGAERFTADFDWSEGKGPSKHTLFYAMQQFFENGGGPCYIVSVGKFLEPFGQTISEGKPFEEALDMLKKYDEPTLLVIPEGQNMDSGTYFGLITKALVQCAELKDRFVIMDTLETGRGLKTDSQIKEAADAFRESLVGDAEQVRYGAAYFPNIRSTFNYEFDESTLKLLRNGSEISYAQLNNAQKANTKLAINSLSIYLPPSATVAGVYARVDNARGVWKAPANESLFAVNGLSCDITDKAQEELNIDVNAGKSINAIRAFTGRGIKVWGARTLDGNNAEWRYISVRRYFNYVEESVKKATWEFVFEPNDFNTWKRAKSMIENFLVLEWRSGALLGATPEQAFYVKVGLNETMSENDILDGKMIVEIGLSVVRPAEFIILRFSHKMLQET
jgi:uncharacterized protein